MIAGISARRQVLIIILERNPRVGKKLWLQAMGDVIYQY